MHQLFHLYRPHYFLLRHTAIFNEMKHIVVLFLLLSNHLYAQPDNFIHYSSNEGLPSNIVYDCLQDEAGFLWFATAAGVSRFDGYSFTNYSTSDGLADNDVLYMFKDHLGKIWFASLNGKVCYYYQNKFHNSSNTPSLSPLDQPSRISGIHEADDGSILISHLYHGARRYDPETQNTVLVHPPETHPPILYSMINEEGDLILVRPRCLQIYSSEGIVDSIPMKPEGNNYFNRVFANGQAYIHLLINSKIFNLDTRTYETTQFYEASSKVNNYCRAKELRHWVCTNSGAVELTTNKKILKNENVAFVFEDSENNIWVGTLTNGLFFSTNYPIRNHLTENDVQVHRVTKLAKDENHIWFVHTGRIGQIDHSPPYAYREYSLPSSFLQMVSDFHINDILFDGTRTLFISDFYTLYRQQLGDSKQVYSYDRLGGKRMAHWTQDEVLIAGSTGMLKVSLKDLPVIADQEGQPDKNVVNEYKLSKVHRIYQGRSYSLFQQSDRKVWVGLNNGLLLLDEDTVIQYHKKFPQLVDRITGIKSNQQGVLFVTTYNSGVYILYHDSLKQISTVEGLSSNLCTSLDLEGLHTLWVGTNQGINKITLDSSYVPKNVTCVNVSHGLYSNDIHDLIIQEGNVWVGTSDGLYSFKTNAEVGNRYAPVIRISEIKAGKEMKRVADTVNLSYDNNDVQISFIGLSYKSLKNIRYKYRLITAENEPTEWQYTFNRSVEFVDLPPGDLRFELGAMNSSDKWSDTSRTYLIIQPPYWQTNWFKALVYLLVLLLLVVFMLLIVRQVHKKEQQKRLLLSAEVKTLKSQMNFHFLSNAFSSMQRFFISHGDLYNHVEQFSQLMRYNLEHTDQDLVALDEELDYLELYVSTEQTRSPVTFEYSSKIHEKINSNLIQIPALSLQPFIENAIKHGIIPKKQPGRIKLTIQPCDEKHYFILIEDDGVGYKHLPYNRSNRKSQGIKLVEERFKMITKGTNLIFSVKIQNNPITTIRGTQVSLQIPYLYHN